MGGVVGDPSRIEGVLLERDRELRAVERAVDAAAGGTGSLVMIEGPAGVGKSRLLEAAREIGGEAGLKSLIACGSDLGGDFPFGVALELLGAPLHKASPGRREELFDGGAARARSLFGSADATLDADDALSNDGMAPLLHGLYWLTWNLTTRTPLVLVIDDCHWSDTASLRFLVYLAQRLEDLPAALLVAYRTGEAGGTQSALLAELGARAGDVLRLSPLSREAVGQLIETQIGEASSEFVEACAEVSGGNPLLLGELLDNLAEEGIPADAQGARAVRAARPDGIAKLMTARMQRLGGDAERLASAVAIFGGRTSIRRAATLAALSAADAGRAADRLERDNVLSQEDGELSFVHPLIHSAVYERIPKARRGDAHGRAARLLAAEDAPEDEVADQLLASHPAGEPWVVDTLSSCAESSSSRGAPEAAARYLRRALEEPPPADRRTDVLRELGRAETAAALPDAIERFETVLERVESPRDRAETLLELGRAAYVAGRLTESTEYYRRGIDELGADEDLGELHLKLEGELSNVGLQVPELAPEIGQRLAGTLERLDGASPSPAASALFAHGALFGTLVGEPWPRCFELARRALRDDQIAEAAAGAEGNSLWAVTGVLSAGGELAMNDELLSEVVAEAQRRGSVAGFASASYCRGVTRYLAGRLTEAIADLESAIDARRFGWAQFISAAYAFLIHSLIDRNELDRIEELLTGAEEVGWGDEVGWAFLNGARGRFHMAQGRPAEALADFERWGERAFPCPALGSDWRHHAALALTRLGDRNRALELVQSELADAERFGAARPIGNALRARGLIEGGEEGIGSLREAVGVLRASENRLDLARAKIDLGAAIRRSGQPRQAREQLRRGLDAAERCGATGLAERAREELLMAGGRPRRRFIKGAGSLTPAELRVVRLAAQGMTNREIAESLFVTVKAIQWHLSNAYRKLEVPGREALAEALAGEEGEAERPEDPMG